MLVVVVCVCGDEGGEWVWVGGGAEPRSSRACWMPCKQAVEDTRGVVSLLHW